MKQITKVVTYNPSWVITVLLLEYKTIVFSIFALDENYDSNDNNIFLNEDLNTTDISSESNDTIVASQNS